MQAYVNAARRRRDLRGIDFPMIRGCGLGMPGKNFPELAARVQNAELSGADRGGVTVISRFEPRVTEGKVF